MKAIILAAGKGNRLYPLTKEIPKALLKLNGETILEHQIQNLRGCGINEIVAVTGFQANKIKESGGPNILYIHNPSYESTNNLVSLWFARNEMDGDFIFLDGDVVFDRQILEELLQMHQDICLVVDRKACIEEDMKVKVKDELIIEINKSMDSSEVYGEFIGIANCFSFYPTKVVAGAEGGIITSDSEGITQKARELRNVGRDGMEPVEITEIGYNYRMTDLQGAIGVEQLKKFDSIIDRRIEKTQRYYRELRNIEWLELPYVPPGYTHTYQSFVALVRGTKPLNLAELNQFRNRAMARLEEQGVATRQGTHAVHTLGYYHSKYNLRDEDYPNSLAADRLSITLPLYPQMTDEEQEYVIEQLKAIKR